MKTMKYLGVMLASFMLFGLVTNAETCTEDCVAQIGEVKYATLNEAVATANVENTVMPEEATVIEILKSANLSEGLQVKKYSNIIFDLNGYTLTFVEGALTGSTGTKSLNIQLLNDSKVTFKNGTLISSKDSAILIQNYCSLTLEDMTLDGRPSARPKANPNGKYYTVSLNNGNINITGNTNIYANEVAFDAYWWPDMGYVNGAKVTVNTTGKVIGEIEVTASSRADKTQSKTILDIYNINHEGTLNVASGLENNVSISAGKFTTDVTAYAIAGTSSLNDGTNYVIGRKINIAEFNEKEGIIKVDKNVVIPGETVKITMEPKDGYRISSLNIVDANSENVAYTDFSFVMPNNDVNITGTFEEIIKEVESNKVDTTKEVDEITVGVNDNKSNDIILDALEESNLDIEGKNIVVAIEIENQEVKEVDEKVVNNITKTLTDKYTNAIVAGYFDITLNVKDSGSNESVGTLTKLGKSIKLSVVLPKELKEVKEGYTRKYYVIRNHNGKIDILNTELSKDGNSLNFETDRFSTYALAYEDVKVELASPNITSPQTFDGITSYLLIGLISIVSFVGISYYVKKKKLFN